jgi:uncharacterized protein YcfL
MKKTLIILFGAILLVGCHKDDILPYNEVVVPKTLEISNSVGIKLESSFVKSEVSMNVKMETEGIVTIKIFDFSNRVVSKETANVKVGDNILKVYRIGLFDSNDRQLGITDFNKL